MLRKRIEYKRVRNIVLGKEDSPMFNKLYDENENPVVYDLKDEFAEIINLVGTETNIEKWTKYKDYGMTDGNSAYAIDCDVSLLAIQVFNKGWGFLSRSRPTKQYGKLQLKIDNISPFECKSAKTGQLLFKSNNVLNVTLVREYKYQLILRNTNPFEYYRGDTMTSFTKTYNHFKRHFVGNEAINKEIEKLAKNYHTIGNMIPIPSGLNMARAGNYAKYDYWDLTMSKIKEWYDSDCDKGRNKALDELLNGKVKISDSINKWLRKFSTWKKFVDENYLNSYVDKVSYNPIVFWDSHSYDNAELPIDVGTFLNYLKVLNTSIEERNRILLNALKTKTA